MFTRAVLAAAGLTAVPVALGTVHAADLSSAIPSGGKDATPSDNKVYIHEVCSSKINLN